MNSLNDLKSFIEYIYSGWSLKMKGKKEKREGIRRNSKATLQ